MNEELIAVLNYMEKERGIDRETVLQALESALLSASRKSLGPASSLRVAVDRATYDIKVFSSLEVVERVKSKLDQITLRRAQKIKPDTKVGEMIEIEVTPRNFGRIAAQTAKQTIFQKIRQAEKHRMFEEYKDRIGDVVSGTVRRFERSDIVVYLGRAEGLLPAVERVPTEEYQIGDRLRAYILDVRNNASGPSIILSRSHPNFVKRLFELEVAEIADKIVEIKGIAREPGFRTKIAVMSHDEKVDPVGACVGMRGLRVKNIVRELSGEKIDIVRWSADTETYIANALAPARLMKVIIDSGRPKTARVVADTEQLSLAIGKKGQNVRLTSKLIGWKIEVQKEEGEVSFEEKVERAVEGLAATGNIGRENAGKLVKAGYLTIEGILAADVAELAQMTGLDADTAKAVHEAAAAGQKPEAQQ